MFLDRYFTGAITVSANGTAVTGTGTAWLANGVQAGDYLHARGLMIRIAAVASNTSLTLAEGWPGAALSGASYAILYRVDADRYGAGQAQLLNTLASGNLSSMAALPGAPNRLPYFAGQNAMAETALTAFGRSLLEDADVAAFWATIGASSGAAQAYRRGNVVGQVSQSGGVPTGALIEYGSNANGEYWRYAGGLQICVAEITGVNCNLASGSLFWTHAIDRTFPVPFVGPAYGSGSVSSTSTSWLNARCTTTGWSASMFCSNSRTNDTIRLIAIGSWH